MPTIQGEIQKTVRRVLKQDIKLKGSGRTDAGVHAYGQTASFEIIHRIPVEKIPRVLNNSTVTLVIKSPEPAERLPNVI